MLKCNVVMLILSYSSYLKIVKPNDLSLHENLKLLNRFKITNEGL